MAEKKNALIIANSHYEDPILRQLVAPAQDAESLAQVLADPAISGFEVCTILDQPRYKVEEEIDTFFLDRDRDDLLLLYFSGHGITDEDGLLYYATCNTQCKRLRSTAVAANFVNDSMIRCRSRRQVLLLDCCHSGAFARAKAAATVNAGQHFAGRTPEEGRGRFVLTASDAYQYSFEGDAVEGHPVYSVFTQALTEGLRTGEADLDGDGLITLDELYSYVHRRVREQNPRQSPRKWVSDVEGGLVIGFNSRPSEAPLPDDLQHAIENLMPEARERAIPRLEKLLNGKHRGLALAAHRALLLLADDDSRRVSAAATKCLDAFAKPTPAEPLPVGAGTVPLVVQPAANLQFPPAEIPRRGQEEIQSSALPYSEEYTPATALPLSAAAVTPPVVVKPPVDEQRPSAEQPRHRQEDIQALPGDAVILPEQEESPQLEDRSAKTTQKVLEPRQSATATVTMPGNTATDVGVRGTASPSLLIRTAKATALPAFIAGAGWLIADLMIEELNRTQWHVLGFVVFLVVGWWGCALALSYTIKTSFVKTVLFSATWSCVPSAPPASPSWSR